jgi:hypothetical protein
MDGKPKIISSIPEEHFLKVKQEAEEKYKKLSPIHCPYLKDKVNFNSEGLDHIKFKSWQKARVISDQYTRLRLLYLVPEILKLSHTVQGKLDRKEWERRKRHGKWEKLLIDVSYWEFVHVIGKVRIKVIIKQVKGGEKFFRSIIPFWRMDEGNKKLNDSDVDKDGNITLDHE